MSPKLARLLVRFYSPEWRARYGEEFAAFLEESPASLKVFFDVVRTGLRESIAQRLRQRVRAFRGVVRLRPAMVTPASLVMAAMTIFAVVAQATPLLAMHRSGENFLTCPDDPRIKYEPGASRVATMVSGLLPRAIENTHSRAFIDSSFALYICTSEKAWRNAIDHPAQTDQSRRELVYICPQSVHDPERIFSMIEDHLRRLKRDGN